MPPPPYPDLGKKARDVFGKGYHFGLIKLDCKTTTASGVQFNSGGVSDQESGKVSGSLESKYTVKDYGVSFTEKWNTSNTLGTEVKVQDLGMKGLAVTAGLNFSPQEGFQTGVGKVSFQNERVALNADADLDPNNQIIKGSGVIGYQGWLAGANGAYDVQNSKLTKANVALGFSTKDFVLHTQVHHEDGKDESQIFSGSMYQRLGQKLESAFDILHSRDGSVATTFGLGFKFVLDADSTIGAKIDNSAKLGLSYEQRVRDGITMTLSTMIDGKNFDQGGHKIGFCLELEA